MTPRQLSFRFPHRPSLAGEDFLVAGPNRDAVAWLDRWPDWPAPALVIYGPPGCGKTHLARVFAHHSGAPTLTADDLGRLPPHELLARAPALILDNAEAAIAAVGERPLRHLFNTVREAGRRLLLTAAEPPARWQLQLADARSRLNSCPAVAIAPPDDVLLAAVLVKLFADRQLRVDDAVVAHLATRIERSFDVARRIVARLDEAALSRRRAPTLALVRALLAEEGGGTTPDETPSAG
jgi:chromosomal replication initiation ATPase DnaA